MALQTTAGSTCNSESLSLKPPLCLGLLGTDTAVAKEDTFTLVPLSPERGTCEVQDLQAGQRLQGLMADGTQLVPAEVQQC